MSTMSYIDEMLTRLSASGESRHEAFLELSFLIQRDVRQHPSYDAMVEGVLGPEVSARRLSPEEIAYATDRLLEIVTTEEPPDVYFVATLGATLDRRMIEPLLAIVDRYGADPDQQRAIGAALYAFAPFRGTFEVEVIERLLERCPDQDNLEQARDFLDPETGYRRVSPEES